MKLFRTRTYTRSLKRLTKLGATPSDIADMEAAVLRSPASGAVIPATGGLRKLRFPYGGQGKRGGGRTIYYFLSQASAVYLIDAYAKVDRSDLTRDDVRVYAALLKGVVDEPE